MTPFLQTNKGVLVRGWGGSSWSSASGNCWRKKPYVYHAAVLALQGKCEGFDAANGIDFYYLFSGELSIRLFPQGGYLSRNLIE